MIEYAHPALFVASALGEIANLHRDIPLESVINDRNILIALMECGDEDALSPDAREYLLKDFDNGGQESRNFIKSCHTIGKAGLKPAEIFHDVTECVVDGVREVGNAVSVDLHDAYMDQIHDLNERVFPVLSEMEMDQNIIIYGNPYGPDMPNEDLMEGYALQYPIRKAGEVVNTIFCKMGIWGGMVGYTLQSVNEISSAIQNQPCDQQDWYAFQNFNQGFDQAKSFNYDHREYRGY